MHPLYGTIDPVRNQTEQQNPIEINSIFWHTLLYGGVPVCISISLLTHSIYVRSPFWLQIRPPFEVTP